MQSDVQRLLSTIDAEYQSAWHALHSFSLTGKHEYITARMDNIGSCHEQLINLVGEQEAGKLVVEQLDKSSK